MKHARPTWKTFVVLTLAVLYLISPLDVIPDVIPILGQTDDAVITIIAWIVSYVLDRKSS